MIAASAVSNIAWPAAALEQAIAWLPSCGISAIELAPFNVFGRWDAVLDDARRLREQIASGGIECLALQGILYQVSDVELFASEASRARLGRHLEGVAALAGALGAKACVFGAPRQRDPGDMSILEARRVAARFFRSIGPAFARHGSALAFEANARRYSCRFITTTQDAAAFVAEVAAPGFALQIDTGTMFLEQEPADVLFGAMPLAVHAHVSEPDLQPVGSAALDHTAIAAALKKGYPGALSIEMRAQPDWQIAVARAVTFVRSVYL